MEFKCRFKETVLGFVRVKAKSAEEANTALAKGIFDKFAEKYEIKHGDWEVM